MGTKKTFRFGIFSQVSTIRETYLRIDELIPQFIDELNDDEQKSIIERYYMFYDNSLERAYKLYNTDYRKKAYASVTDSTLAEVYYFGYLCTVLYMINTHTVGKMELNLANALLLFKKVEANRYHTGISNLIEGNRNQYYHNFVRCPHKAERLLKKLKDVKVNSSVNDAY